MKLKWENIENAINNLIDFNKARSYIDFYNLKPKNLIKINGEYYIVEDAKNYGDWAEYGIKNILTNEKAYLEIDDGELSIWKRLDKLKEKELLMKINKGDCYLTEEGRTEEYLYKEYMCDNNLYSLEVYPDGSKEIYKFSVVYDKEII